MVASAAIMTEITALGVPITLTQTAVELQELVKKYGVKTFSIYICGEDSPYGIVHMGGDMRVIMSGIHAMIADIAKNTGKPESEIAEAILASTPKEVNTVYN